MPTIKLTTSINAPIQICFDQARSIDLHLDSFSHTNEQAVAGKTSGLINLGETVTWRAKHFGITMQMTIKITQMMFATSFTDEQLQGPFKFLKHRHIFQFIDQQRTLMIDEFDFASAFGIAGRFVDKLIMKSYLSNLLLLRNAAIKQWAEAVCVKTSIKDQAR